MKKNITEGSIPKILLNMALGMLIGHIAMTAFNLTDTYFVSKLGTLELAAMSYTFPVVMLVNNFLFGIGLGTSAVISRAIGQKNHDEVTRISTASLFLIICLGTFFGIAGLLTIRPVFSALGAKGETLELVLRYMRICCYGMPVGAVPMVIDNAIRATGDTKTPGLIMLTVVVINIILDPLFIFGIGFFPRMGIEGAALATMIAKIASAVLVVSFMHFRMKMFDFSGIKISTILESWRKVLWLGIPASLSLMLVPISNAIVTRITAGYGDEAVASLGAGIKIDSLLLVGVFSLSSVLLPFTGQNFGAGKINRVKSALKISELFSLCWGVFMLLAFLVFRRNIAGMFTKDPVVLKYVMTYMLIIGLSFPAIGGSIMCVNVINGLQKPIRSTVLNFMRTIVMLIPAVWTGGKIGDVTGIFTAISATSITAFFIYHATAKITMEKA